jgi:RNA polymerase sigma-70 factor, ECF subfamily
MSKRGQDASGDQADDRELIARYLDDDDAASFNQLYERYRKQLYAYLNRLLSGQQAVADDLFQQSWIRVVRQLPHYRHREKFLAWLMRIAHNLAMDHYRRSRHESPQEDFDNREWFSPSGDEPWRHIERSELGRILDGCIAKLTPEQREVFLLRQEEVAFREIAGIQDCSINTALGRMQYALRNLQRCLAAGGIAGGS